MPRWNGYVIETFTEEYGWYFVCSPKTWEAARARARKIEKDGGRVQLKVRNARGVYTLRYETPTAPDEASG